MELSLQLLSLCHDHRGGLGSCTLVEMYMHWASVMETEVGKVRFLKVPDSSSTSSLSIGLQ